MLRNSTERPELIECGSTMLCGTKSCDIVEAVNIMMNSPNDWKVPAEYQIKDVSDRVVKLLLGETK
jgi:UDP-N-acetylglucosamine 2-epimerase (non-hydrolysing)